MRLSLNSSIYFGGKARLSQFLVNTFDINLIFFPKMTTKIISIESKSDLIFKEKRKDSIEKEFHILFLSFVVTVEMKMEIVHDKGCYFLPVTMIIHRNRNNFKRNIWLDETMNIVFHSTILCPDDR